MSNTYIKLLFTAALFYVSGNILNAQSSSCPIIPQPVKAVKTEGAFTLSRYTPILVKNEALQHLAGYLQQELLDKKQLPLSIQEKSTTPAIQLELMPAKASTDEAYRLRVTPRLITISAGSVKGVFYGVVSLLQLVQLQNGNAPVNIPAWEIDDAPQYAWRGMMVDESRHFFGKATVKKLLDWMAFYKLNTFHWHLTDEPGWRIEIKKYPMLTLVGGIGTFTNPITPAQYYTQDDIREIVQYAAERQITVVPEIDMPGHATAANKAYPQFSGGGNEKHPDYTFNPGNEATYQYLTDILREVNALFPSQMLHVGGDEVHFGNDKWMSDAAIQTLMQKNKLKDAPAVERYFMERMADSIKALHSKFLAWDEVADMDLPKDESILFWWRQEAPQQLIKALDKNYKVVICPRLPFYFDFVQDSTHTQGRKWDKKYNDIASVYNFSLATIKEIAPNHSAQVLGLQANVWTETMPDERQLFYMIFPRIAALAETSWTRADKKDFNRFNTQIQPHFQLYRKDDINFYRPSR